MDPSRFGHTGGGCRRSATSWSGPARRAGRSSPRSASSTARRATASTSRRSRSRRSRRSRSKATSTGPSSVARRSPTPAGGSRLYAVVQSPADCSTSGAPAGATALMGVFVSKNGNPSGPWTKSPTPTNLATSGSALERRPGLRTRACRPGTTSSSPSTRRTRSTSTWASRRSTRPRTAAAPGRDRRRTGTSRCRARARPDRHCPHTTHPDQHAVADRRRHVYVGNDGGVYTRGRCDQRARGWIDLNAHPAHACSTTTPARPATRRRRRRSGAACRTTATRCSARRRGRWSRRSAATAATSSSTRPTATAP